MRDICARLTPLGWVVLVIVAIILADIVFPYCLAFFIWTAVFWGVAYVSAWLAPFFGWE